MVSRGQKIWELADASGLTGDEYVPTATVDAAAKKSTINGLKVTATGGPTRTFADWMATITGLNVLGSRGQLIRQGASAPEAFSAKTANTFVGGDGTDVTSRTAAQVLASLAAVGTTFQPLDTDLTDIAAITRARGDLIRGDASAWGKFSAKTADTFVGGDGTDVTTRTAAQVRTSLSLVTGSYDPTGTIVANLDSITMFGGSGYARVNDIVVVAGAVLADATTGAGTATSLGVSLPVASNFGGTVQCTGAIAGPLGMVGTVTADATNDRAQMDWAAQSTSSQTLTYIFLYRII